MAIAWTPNLNTGINVIDQQHRQIVDYINNLEAANLIIDKRKVKEIVDSCVDYTLSHFAFEESLQEDAGYQYVKAHKRVHELFTRKVGEYQERLNLGEDIGKELHDMLARWLVSHIKHDDADYVSAVKTNMISLIEEKETKKETKGWFARFFK
ncbi:bacteriohemerythrin [Ferribacterium limneticum]|uniref:bacteriohemerythrin n=1 Tax=Ferribacterium limneticum TaxID=76259 RepID=UPI001CFC1038|nr:bacteriohemerythrin [Ferribacterium limneticum]UCV18483.1 bacteriohemerythrin [Ferribacterium limneticum]